MSDCIQLRHVVIDGNDLLSWESFHDAFARAFRFFDSYGRNMDAWIDCMSSLDEIDGVTSFALTPDEDVLIEISHFEEFTRRAGDVVFTLLGCTAFVNRRYKERNGRPRITVAPM